MTNTHPRSTSKRARLGAAAGRVGLIIGLICGAAALLAGPGYRVGLLSLSDGLQAIRWAASGAIAGAVMALLALFLLSLVGAPRRLSGAAAALALNALVAGPPLYMYWQVQHLPHIHDVSTDTDEPPSFVALVPIREGARNPIDYRSETAVQQKRGYPDIAPLRLDATPAQAFGRAERAARAMGWEIVAVSPNDLRIEATDTTLLFGFKDDVVIRVRPQAQGSIIDMRSLSRVGGSDFGVNAKRIRAFLHKVTTD